MIDLNNPFATSVFFAARPLFDFVGGKAVRRFAASFVFAGAAGLVLVAGASQIQQAVSRDDDVAHLTIPASPEYTAMLAKLEAQERQAAAVDDREASIR